MESKSFYCCICGVYINRKQQKQSVTHRENDIPENVCENDHICKSCSKLAAQSFKEKQTPVILNMEVFEENKQTHNGECSKNRDNNVCLICNTSLVTRQSLFIRENDPTELDHLMLNFISEALPPQIKIGKKDKLCSKCWFKVRRSAIDLQQMNDLKSHEIEDSDRLVSEIKSEPENGEEHSDHLTHLNEVEIKNEHKDPTYGDHSSIHDNKDPTNGDCSLIYDNEDPTNSDDSLIHDNEDDPNDPDFRVTLPSDNKIHKKELKPTERAKASTGILLPNYIRCASTKCLFQNCNRGKKTFRCISNIIREKILLDCRFYIPYEGRVCQEHLQMENWRDSKDCINRMKKSLPLKFNTKHIEDMFSMVQIKKNTDLDFDNILYFDDNLLQHLFGIKKETLTILLTKLPEIKDVRGRFAGLLGLLLKHENGGCNIRIASLLKTKRSTLERGMEEVKKILSKTQVTKGLEHLYMYN